MSPQEYLYDVACRHPVIYDAMMHRNKDVLLWTPAISSRQRTYQWRAQIRWSDLSLAANITLLRHTNRNLSVHESTPLREITEELESQFEEVIRLIEKEGGRPLVDVCREPAAEELFSIIEEDQRRYATL